MFGSPYFLKISYPPLFKVKYLKNYSMVIKKIFSHLKLPSIWNILFPRRPIDSKIKVISISKNMKKTVIFLILTDIKSHNFKYIGRLLIKFGHHNIGFLGFGMELVLFENIYPLRSTAP